MPSIVGTLPIEHSVDPNGSLVLTVPIRVPPAKLKPEISISYHSAVHELSVLGHGWDLKAFGLIQRTAATAAQDGFAGSVNYDANDRFTLNGQRLMKISGNEYRYEIEQWSKVVAVGSNPVNPDSWIEYLPTGTVRLYGTTKDSKISGEQSVTRVWALAEEYDPFKNYASYFYTAANGIGFLTLQEIRYGGNRALSMEHQRLITFSYSDRTDVEKEFVGGSVISLAKRLVSISASFNNTLLYTHTFDYGYAPVTGRTRLQAVTLSDASGASVSPLTFKWSNASSTVFGDIVVLDSIKPPLSTSDILTIDVDGSGRTDLVLASRLFDPLKNMDVLSLDVYLTGEKGNISTVRQPGSGSTGLRYPDQLLALDVDGDGKTDLLHISRGLKSYTLTVLLATASGYKAQKPITFTPIILGGKFYSGDFQGDGNIGLVYFFNKFSGGQQHVNLIEFTSNGSSFSERPAVQGPAVNLNDIQVVISDFNGNGTSDIFLLSRVFSKGKNVCKIDFMESLTDGFVFRSDNPFADVSDKIPWGFGDTLRFLALPERDGKTGLLILSRSDQNFLQFRTLRSTGKSFEVSKLTTTTLLYNGKINLGHSVTTSSLDLVNTYETKDGVQVSVLHFINGTFVNVTGATKPPGASLKDFEVHFVDLRGTGKADCLFTRYNASSKELQLRSLPATGDIQAPADFIVGYTGGLGATFTAVYSPLTDSTIYSTSTGNSGSAANPYVNALSRASSFHLTIDGSGQSDQPKSNEMGSSRTQLVHFPKYVVKELTGCALPSLYPETVSRAEYFYTAGKLSFDGRGWLGFGSMTQRSKALGTETINVYNQHFPFIGQITETITRDIADPNPGNMLKSVAYAWESQLLNQGKNRFTAVTSVQETSYESGSRSYSVDVTHKYDSYANLIQTTIATAGKPHLVIDREYGNDSEGWIIGSKLSESISSDHALLKRNYFEHLPKTQTVNRIQERVSDSQYSLQTFSFDATGNVVKVAGPWEAQRTFDYDSTYTFPTKVTASVTDQSSLTTLSSYDYGLGKAASVTDYNGHIRTHQYDVLGRVIEIAEGNGPNEMTVIDKQQYTLLDGYSVRVHSTLCDLASDSWSRETEYLDGMERTWKKAIPGVSDPSITVYNEVIYDGAGRIVQQSRDYTSKMYPPVFTTYYYDCLSRKTKVLSPPATADTFPVTTTYEYRSARNQTTITETKHSGNPTASTTTTKTIHEYFPNPDAPSNQFVVPLAVSSVDEANNIITTAFDALHRVVNVIDPSGVSMSQQWDGISRLTSRKISNPDGMTPSSISHFSIDYNDPSGSSTVTNRQTNSTIVLLKDRLGRLIQRTTPDEEVTFTYDDANVQAQGRLSSAASSNGALQSFSYSPRGDLESATLEIDGLSFKTSFKHTAGRQLKEIVNPDGSILTKTYFPNTSAVKQVQLQDGSGLNTNVSIAFSNLDNAFFVPLVSDLGNGLKSTLTIADNGIPLKAVLSKGGVSVQEQTWKLNSNGHFSEYNPTSSPNTNRIFQYTVGGQLMHSQTAIGTQSANYTYDSSGNVLSKDGNTYHNQGWQLTSITDPFGQLSRSFEYTADGHLAKERNGSGSEVRNMTYNAFGQVTSVNSNTFVYDFNGRMIKASDGKGSITYYPSENYEVTVQDGRTTQTAYLVHQRRRAGISTVINPDKQRQASVSYYHVDHLGSVIAVSDKDGNISTTYSYDDYGAVTVVQGPDTSRYKYSGKEAFDGLYYFGARFYDPTTSRFTALDNITFSIDNIIPSTLNQYAFSRNDPINFLDLNGNLSFWWHLAWHLAVDAVLLAAAAVVTFVLPELLPAAGLISETLVGAGLGGLSQDANTAYTAVTTGTKKINDTAWGAAVGIGGLFAGTGSLATSAAGKAGYSAVEVTDLVALRSGGFARSQVTNLLAREGVNLGISMANDVAKSVVEQLTSNAMDDRSLSAGVGAAARDTALSSVKSEGQSVVKSGGMAAWKSRSLPKVKGLEALAFGSLDGVGKPSKAGSTSYYPSDTVAYMLTGRSKLP